MVGPAILVGLAAVTALELSLRQAGEPLARRRDAMDLPGLLYTDRHGVEPALCSWVFWMFHKSKKVWFRVPESVAGEGLEPHFFYLGRRIRFAGDLAALTPDQRRRERLTSVVWGEAVAHGWGRGPRQTNHYLYIWTRWSLLHPACGEPERFTLRYPLRPSPGESGG